MANYEVIVLLDIPSKFTYRYEDDDLPPGQLVIVSFRNRDTAGVICGKNSNYDGRIKSISSILPYVISESYVHFAEFVARYTMSTIGSIMRLIIPFSVEKILTPEKNIRAIEVHEKADVDLNSDQREAVEKIQQYKSRPILLHGVTGSGKTEVFLEILKGMTQALIMVPEISLSNELAKDVSSRLGIPVYIWHHSVSPIKKRDIWKKAVNGEKMIIVGARSSLFIPFSKLEGIVIDEEQDSSFKQSEGITYNARDMGIYLGHTIDIPVILSSATPSIETYSNAISGKYEYVSLKNRYFENAKFPEVYVDDIRKQTLMGGVLSQHSIQIIKRCLEDGKQALIFINRRGHTPKILCNSCGGKITCPSCDTWLCYHMADDSMLCHYCGYKIKKITRCPKCHKETLVGIGIGIEKASKEIGKIFSESRILSLSSDNMNTPNKISKSIKMIKNHEVDIIIGTQIIAKGHNFMNLNTIVVTCIDSMLYGEDFRSTEKAFQIIHQVAGRAGRSEHSGDNACVIFQTYNPDDRLLELLSSNDMKSFYDLEISNRKLTKMPPFGRIISVLISSHDKNKLDSFAKEFLKNAPSDRNIKVMGPITPNVFRLRNQYRLKFMILSRCMAQEYVSKWLKSAKISKDVRVAVDVDPYEFG
ncbi:MAG: primosomal protein N' [Holosporales bacterium]|jgi:primosomal protein N' (replication factor Y)|nr:primosomal protein N' [Holosporales bacterium]